MQFVKSTWLKKQKKMANFTIHVIKSNKINLISKNNQEKNTKNQEQQEYLV